MASLYQNALVKIRLSLIAGNFDPCGVFLHRSPSFADDNFTAFWRKPCYLRPDDMRLRHHLIFCVTHSFIHCLNILECTCWVLVAWGGRRKSKLGLVLTALNDLFYLNVSIYKKHLSKLNKKQNESKQSYSIKVADVAIAQKQNDGVMSATSSREASESWTRS